MSAAVSENSKRIARNTIFLYIRMFVVMGVMLYTTRVVLDTLGVVDYGIYNVVGGLALSFGFFQSSLTNATQRYLNIALGRGDMRMAGNLFNLNMLIYITIAVVVFVAVIVPGDWILNHWLNIPLEQMDAARWVLWSVGISLAVTIVSLPYESVIIARENMKIYAWVGLLDAFMKLGIAFTLLAVPEGRLKLYAVLLAAETIIVRLVPVFYCSKLYEECRLYFYMNRATLIEMFGFIGWNTFGCLVYMLNSQGLSILLNMFFGPVVNAARGVATQVDGTVSNFGINFFTAVRPQIIKQYAAGEHKSMMRLVFNSSRYGFYLIWIISLPLMLRIGYVLNLWLKDVPDYTAQFLIWTLPYCAVNVLTQPWWSAIQAVGKLRAYLLVGSLVELLAFPAAYVAFVLGAPPVVAFQILLLTRALFLVTNIIITRRFIPFAYRDYFYGVVGPIGCVAIITAVPCVLINPLIPDTFLGLVSMTAISMLLVLTAVLAVATPSERAMIKNFIRKKILHKA